MGMCLIGGSAGVDEMALWRVLMMKVMMNDSRLVEAIDPYRKWFL